MRKIYYFFKKGERNFASIFQFTILLIGAVSLGYILLANVNIVKAWTEPSGPYPAGDFAAPINVSSESQAKAGKLTLGDVATVPPHELLLKTPTGSNAELNIQSGNLSYWGLYHDQASGDFRFWNESAPGNKNVLSILKSGNIRIPALSGSEEKIVTVNSKGILESKSIDMLPYVKGDIIPSSEQQVNAGSVSFSADGGKVINSTEIGCPIINGFQTIPLQCGTEIMDSSWVQYKHLKATFNPQKQFSTLVLASLKYNGGGSFRVIVSTHENKCKAEYYVGGDGPATFSWGSFRYKAVAFCVKY